MKLFKKNKVGNKISKGARVIGGVYDNKPKNNRQRHGGAGVSHVRGIRSRTVGNPRKLVGV